MESSKKHIIEGLRKELLSIQGLDRSVHNNLVDKALGQIRTAFPNQSFPVSAVHEFISQKEDTVSTIGFIGVLLSALMNSTGVALWISSNHAIYPPALLGLGIPPDKIIFIYLPGDKQIAWAMEEALKCDGLAAVIAEIKDLNFTTSRRLQLAVEKSHVTGFVLRTDPRELQANACVSRWKIKSLASELPGRMPGVGFPRWQIELLKIRNGHPGKWTIEFRGGRIRYINTSIAIVPQLKKEAV